MPQASRVTAPAIPPEGEDPLDQLATLLAAAGEANPLDKLMPYVHADLRRLARAAAPQDGDGRHPLHHGAGSTRPI